MTLSSVALGVLAVVAATLLFRFLKHLRVKQAEIEALVRERFPEEDDIVMQNPNAYCMGHQSMQVQKRGCGPLVLTEEELLFAMPSLLMFIAIPLSSIRSVTRARRFKAKGILKTLIRVDFQNDEGQEDAIAWYVKDLELWMQALQERTVCTRSQVVDAGHGGNDFTNREYLKQLWSDPRYYKGSVYRCQKDPRVVVPKRQPETGWTLNFAHSRAWWVLASMPLAGLLPVALALLIGPKNVGVITGAIVLGGALVVTLCERLNSKAIE